MSYDDVLGDDNLSENMKKFGLEFVLENKSQQTFAKLMDQQKRLETQLNNNIKAFNKFQSSLNNTKLDTAVKRMDKLTNAVARYNSAMKGSTSLGNLSGPNTTNDGGLSSGVKDFLTADFISDSIGKVSNNIVRSFESMPFGSLYSGFLSDAFDGIATSIATGSIGPAIVGAITGGIETATNIYAASSELVHNAIYSAFQKGSQLIVQAITTYVPQTLDREYDQAKLNAVLGDDRLGQSITTMGVDYAKNSSLSLADVDFVLPNLVMANKASGVGNDKMQELIQAELEAITRLNFKDSGQGAGVQGSLVAIQEMLSGDMISLQRRFEMGGASIDRIKDSLKKGPAEAINQLITELETMGVTDDALAKVQESAKFKLGFIEESLTDFFTNPNTGIMASLIAPFEPAIDNIAAFFENGGGVAAMIPTDIPGVYEELTQLDVITNQFKMVLGKIGEIGMKLGESFFEGFIMNVDWEGLWTNASALLDTLSTYFTPTFEILSGWVNETFIPWLADINELLQNEEIRQSILDFIEGLTDIATRSLNMVTSILTHMPTISSVVGAMNDFLGTVQSAVDGVASVFQSILTVVQNARSQFSSEVGILQQNAGRGLTGKAKVTPKKSAVGMPYVPKDDYPVLLHKGERVLTAQQNRQYNNGGGGNVSIPKLADTIVIREDADIDRVADRLVKKLKSNMVAYGGAY